MDGHRGFFQKLTGQGIDVLLRSLSEGSRALPRGRRMARGIPVTRDIAYGPGPRHRLDIYRPRGGTGPFPVVFYVHGGGFRILSKDTHWMMGCGFADMGCLVVNIDYRLAPAHPYPAACEDVCRAWSWLLENVSGHGGDLDRVVLAGESAGANLVTSLAVAISDPRPEPWARAVFDSGTTPRAVLAACGLFEVGGIDRYLADPAIPGWMKGRLVEVSRSYLPSGVAAGSLADPLLLLESGHALNRTLPPFFLPVGGADFLVDDSRRLQASLEARGIPCEMRVFPGEGHAFHAMIWKKAAIECWQSQREFMSRYVPGVAPNA